jgi:methylenetetrahydrofolate dehydrogenase (NADP+)/methenyltetrahydrofolate cyclohydrolase
LLRHEIPIAGKHVVVLGRSDIVGKPVANLLLNKGPGGDATVTVGHSRSRDLPGLARTADILIAAVGRPRLVTAEWVRPGATVIDVGIHRLENGLCGVVEYEAVAAVAGAITPVPGGVGPMTVTMLLRNTLAAARDLVSRE